MQEKLNPTYNYAVQAIKQAVLESQLRAARHVNEEQLALYFGIGKYISDNSRNGQWGTGAVENINRQLSIELPGLKGFSARNLMLMRQFYEKMAAIRQFRSHGCGITTSSKSGHYSKPMGVATYKLRQEQLKDVLPDEEEMRKLL